MRNFNALLIASLTPQEIEAGSHSPKEIFDLMISTREIPEEKIRALLARKDFKGKVAFNILKKTAEVSGYSKTKEFELIFDLYIKKFIEGQDRENSLIYTILTTQLWFHDIGSGNNLKSVEAQSRIRVLNPIFLAFFNRWPEYRKNTDLLIKDLNDIFGKYYDENFCFPEDSEAPWLFSCDNHVYREVRSCVFPFLGETLRNLSEKGEACVSPESALPLVTDELIGDRNWTFYLEKISQEFVIDDLKYFDHQALEKFFISKKETDIYQRLRKLWETEDIHKIFKLSNFRSEFAGITLLENQEYANFSLREKIAFFKVTVKGNYDSSYRNPILKFLTADAAWYNGENDLKDLVEIFMDNIDIFQNTKYFYVIKAFLLKKAYPISSSQESVTEVIKDGNDGNVSDKLRDDLNKDVNFLIKSISAAETKNPERFESSFYKDWYIQLVIDKAFTKMLVDISTYFFEQRAVKLILDSLPYDIKNPSGYEECVDYLIVHSYEISDLESVLCSFEKSNQKKIPITEKLAKAMARRIDLLECQDIRLKLAIRALCRRPFGSPLVIYFVETLDKALKAFSSLESLIEALKKITTSYEERCGKMIEDSAANLCKCKKDFIVFKDSGYFQNKILAWRWYFYHNPLQDFSEIQDLQEFKEIFNSGDRGPYDTDIANSLVELWQSKPFSDTPAEIFFSFIHAQPNEHPSWKELPLDKRIDFVIDGILRFNKRPEKLLESLEDGFAESWVLENWTASRYLEKIKPIKDKYYADDFAALAIDLL